MSSSTRPLWIVLCAVGIAACGGSAQGSFGTRFPDNVRAHLARALAAQGGPSAAAAPANALGKPLLVAGAFGQNKLFAYDLAAGRRMWERPGRVDSRPTIGGRVVVYVSGPDLVCLSLETGAEMWRLDREGRSFRGAAIAGDGVFVTLGEPELGAGSASSTERSMLLGIDAESGSVRFRHELDHLLAAPGAAGDLVAVPWDRQNLSLLDAGSGDEIARLRSTDDVLSFAIGTPSGIYYGSKGVYHLTARSVSGTRSGAAYFQPTLEDMPGNPAFGVDGYAPQAEGRSARDRIRFHWAPAAPSQQPERVTFAGGAIYLLYYRYVFAFTAETGALRWVHRNRGDVTTMSVTSGGPIFIDDQGGMAMLDATTGIPRWRGTVRDQIIAASFDAEGFAPAAAPPEADPGMRRRLLEIVLDPDNRLSTARAFAAGLLAKLEDAETTGDLIDIAARRNLPQPIRTVASTALLERRLGGDAVVQALARRYSFLDGSEGPPAGLLARAAKAMALREAVPGLIRQLESHETEAAALPDVVAAIVELGDRQAAAPLREFVVRYHADDLLGDHHAALALAAAGAIRLGGRPEIVAMRRVAEDPYSLPDVVAAINTALDARDAPDEPSPAVAEGVQEEPAETPAEPEEEGPPRFLSDAQVQEMLSEQYGEMRHCVLTHRTGPSPPARVRVVFVLFSDGHAERTTISPPNAEAGQCIAEILATLQFPRILDERQQVTYWLPIRAPSIPAGNPAPPAAAPAPNP